MIWRYCRTFEGSTDTVGHTLHVYLVCFWRDWGHLDTPKYLPHQNGIEFEGYSYWCGWSCSVTFFTRVRSINWCPLLRVTIRTSIAAWSQGLRLTGRDIELYTRFDTPNSPELTPTSNSRVTASYWCGWPCSVTFLQEYGRQTGIHSREWLLGRPSRPALRVCV